MGAGFLITQRSRVQIPPPLLISAGQGHFPIRGRAFCVPGTVVRNVVGTGLRAAWQRDGGDGVIRDETAWTWWTLPPAIAGCPAQRYRKCIPVPAYSCSTSRNVRSPGLGQGPQWLLPASGCQEREFRAPAEAMTAPRDAAVPTARAQRPAAVAYVLKGAGKPEADAEAEPDWQARSARTRWNPGRSPRDGRRRSAWHAGRRL
jgi:hypothetical protein